MAVTDTCKVRSVNRFVYNVEIVKKGEIMFKKEPLRRVALNLPKSLLQRLDTRLGLERASHPRLTRTQLIAHAITFYLTHHESAAAERMAFSRSVEARLTRLIQADHELLELLLRLYVAKEHITTEDLKAELKHLRTANEQRATAANGQPKER